MNTVRKISDVTRYEPKTGESGFFEVKQRRGKRPLDEMLRELDSPLEQASYALRRIVSFEDQIAGLLRKLSPATKELVLQRRPSLRVYMSR